MSIQFVRVVRGGKWLAAVVPVLLASSPVSAHEKWFYNGPTEPTCWCALGERRAILTVGIVLALTLGGFVAWRWRGRRDLLPGPRQLGATAAGRERFYAIVPALLAVHLAIPLMAAGINAQLLSPNLVLTGGSRYFIALAEMACALALFYGALTRLAAIVLAAIWLGGCWIAGWEAMAENLYFLGFAAFFYLCGRGPYSIDRLLFPRLEPPPVLTRCGIPSLRVAIGLSLAFVAFTEKLANPGLAAAFLREHPVNFTARLHIPMCDATFALCCGGIELLVGLWVALNLFPRTIILIAFIPFNMSLAIFHWQELVGHLPFYGALALFVLWSPGAAEDTLWVRALSVPHSTECDRIRLAEQLVETLAGNRG